MLVVLTSYTLRLLTFCYATMLKIKVNWDKSLKYYKFIAIKLLFYNFCWVKLSEALIIKVRSSWETVISNYAPLQSRSDFRSCIIGVSWILIVLLWHVQTLMFAFFSCVAFGCLESLGSFNTCIVRNEMKHHIFWEIQLQLLSIAVIETNVNGKSIT